MTMHNLEQGHAGGYHDNDVAAAYGDTGAGDDVGVQLPADAGRMIGRWRELGGPFIELEPGVVISNLERWLYNNPPAPGVWLARVREYLYIDSCDVGGMAA